ncbi:MAG TPA: DoxX family protein [Candidatus Aquilonibacter sp.]|nr:DoxX family protein [Candidatus Aquilonibacter sp.]
MKLPSSSTYGFWLAVLRLYTGAFWLMHGIPKFTHSDVFMPPSGMMQAFVNNAVSNTSGPYQTFLAAVVLPHATIFAEIVRVGEVVTGCLLLLGFYTRTGAVIGMLLALNYLSAKGGWNHLSLWSGIDATAFVLCFMNFVLSTGRVLGIDALLGRNRRAVPAAPAAQAVFVDEPPMTGPTAPTA